MKLQRQVLPEHLDVLPIGDPVARRSRRDLRRVHRVMRSLTILRRAVGTISMIRKPRRILELGAGDGSLMLRFAQSLRPPWRDVEVTFIDRQDLIGPEIREPLGLLGWDVQVLRMDALDWARAASDQQYDLCLTTLLLHHFQFSSLEELLRDVGHLSPANHAATVRRGSAAICLPFWAQTK
jgi:hypothetical protein